MIVVRFMLFRHCVMHYQVLLIFGSQISRNSLCLPSNPSLWMEQCLLTCNFLSLISSLGCTRKAGVRLCPCVYLLCMFFTCNACWDFVLERVAMLIKDMLCWVAVIPFYGFYRHDCGNEAADECFVNFTNTVVLIRGTRLRSWTPRKGTFHNSWPT